MTKDYQIDVSLREITTGTEVFSEAYKIALWDQFVNNSNPKEHGFTRHVESFLIQLKKNCLPVIKKPIKKREIYVVDYLMNVGSEVNGQRPSIVYKHSENTLGEDVIVIPLTSAAKEKQTDRFDVLLPTDDDNALFQNSWVRVRQMRSVSTKRLGKSVGVVTDQNVIAKINETVKAMLATEE